MAGNLENRIIRMAVILSTLFLIGFPAAMFLTMALTGDTLSNSHHFWMIGTWPVWGIVLTLPVAITLVFSLIVVLVGRPRSPSPKNLGSVIDLGDETREVLVRR